jgi:hypothetical protein
VRQLQAVYLLLPELRIAHSPMCHQHMMALPTHGRNAATASPYIDLRRAAPKCQTTQAAAANGSNHSDRR